MSKYSIAAKDSAPIVIGGVGGSGTRLVTQLLQQQGVVFAGDKNEELDNLWFSLLFVDRDIFSRPAQEIEQRVWLFVNAMRDRESLPEKLTSLLNAAARFDRGPALRQSVLQAARKTIDDPAYAVETAAAWGWKQPNVQVMVPLIAPYLAGMKYIYVVRNGLDMAFGYNQNQLKYFWGDFLLGDDAEVTPANALRYWVASYKRNCAYRGLLGDRLYLLNFDLLCANPRQELLKLNDFLGLNPLEEALASAESAVVTPGSTGRYKHHDCSQLYSEDIDFVRSLGFDTERQG